MSPRDELRALLQRYSRATDDRDIETLEGLFHPEAEISGVRGAKTLEQWLETMLAPRAFPRSMHVIGEPLISLEDGAHEATLDTYAVVYQLSDPDSGNGDLTLGIRFHDDVVVHEGRWVFRRRTSHTLWMR